MKFTYSEHTSGRSILTALKEPGWQLPSLFTCSSMGEGSSFWIGFSHQNKVPGCILLENSSSLLIKLAQPPCVCVLRGNPFTPPPAFRVHVCCSMFYLARQTQMWTDLTDRESAVGFAFSWTRLQFLKCWFQVLIVGVTTRTFVFSECGTGTDVLMVLLAVVGSILLVGVVLLAVWKLVITVHDWREFSRFQSARSRARYEMVRMDNPSLI